jgi:peptidoglycan/LPS O-acetylase OafA/YrhL
MTYYLVLPLIVSLYYFVTRFKCVNWNLWLYRAVKTLMILTTITIYSLLIYLTIWERKDLNRRWIFYNLHFRIPEFMCVFVSGSIAGICFWELQNAGLCLKSSHGLPKQLEYQGLGDYKFEPQSMNLETICYRNIAPWKTYVLRILLDAFCYVCFILVILLDYHRLPHYSHLLPWIPRFEPPEFPVGVLYAILLLFALLSEKSFNRLFHWNFATFAGKISFSLYLFHPIAVDVVFNQLWGANGVSYAVEMGAIYSNTFPDLFFYSLAASWIFGTLGYFLIEVPSQWICKRIIDRFPKL